MLNPFLKSKAVDLDDGVISPFELNSSDQIEEENESEVAGNPEPTSSWRAQFFPAENEATDPGPEKNSADSAPGHVPNDTEENRSVEENRGSRMSSLNWFHSTIEYEDENQVDPGLGDAEKATVANARHNFGT